MSDSNTVVDIFIHKLKRWTLTRCQGIDEAMLQLLKKQYGENPTWWDYLAHTYGVSEKSDPSDVLFSLLFEYSVVNPENSAAMVRFIQLLLRHVEMDDDARERFNIITEESIHEQKIPTHL